MYIMLNCPEVYSEICLDSTSIEFKIKRIKMETCLHEIFILIVYIASFDGI